MKLEDLKARFSKPRKPSMQLAGTRVPIIEWYQVGDLLTHMQFAVDYDEGLAVSLHPNVRVTVYQGHLTSDRLIVLVKVAS
jgi:hypothetical protein